MARLLKKKLRILHTSDRHGSWRPILGFEDFDLWIDSGDWMPNITRGTPIEARFQASWMTLDKLKLRKLYQRAGDFYPTDSEQPPHTGSIAQRLTTWLAGRPMLCVPGNHDYADLAACLRTAGAQALNLTKGPAKVGGLRFAGMREIPVIAGEWAGESGEPELRAAVERVMSFDPQVLVTHSPPNGILDLSDNKGGHVGISALTQWLVYRPHRVQLVLFGHVHEQPAVVREMDIMFSNAAQTARILEVEV